MRKSSRHTPEARTKNSAAHAGKRLSSEHRASISTGMKGKGSVSIGSTLVNAEGYRLIKTAYGWQREHRVVMGLIAGDLRVVHHINHDKLDNRSENLRVFESNAKHSRHHGWKR